MAAAGARFAAARDLLAEGDPAAAASAGYHLCMSSLRAGELASGVACVEESIAGFRAGGALDDLAAALATAGRAYDVLAEPDRAFAAYEEALALARRVGSADLEAKGLNNLAALHSGLGEVERALALYEEALAIFRRSGNRLWEVRVLHNLGTNYLMLGDLHRARLLLEEALAGRIETGNRDGEAITRNVLGRVIQLAGDRATALLRQREALAIWLQEGSVPGQVRALLAIARTERESGDAAAALSTLAEVERVLDPAEHPREATLLRAERGQARLATGDLPGALADLAAAVERRAAERDPWGEAEALAALAAALRRDGRLAEAEKRLAASVERIEAARLRVPGSELRATFLGRWREVYEEWIDVLMALHAGDPAAGFDRRAFAVAERARARSLAALLAEAEAPLEEAVDPELRERRLALRRRVAAKAERLAGLVDGGDEAAMADAERELYETVAALEILDAEVRGMEPRLAELEAPPTADAADLAGRLAADELLV
ncbi:MAG TPA: tetratricopeptide repeat protein, partial [Thermoanaerobaculia bacterium]|nr:tetratricopeptide repeat protein [Thermoanaerobaculia bacterium]